MTHHYIMLNREYTSKILVYYVHAIRVGVAGADELLDAVWDYHSIPLANWAMFPTNIILIRHLAFHVWRIVTMDIISNDNEHTPVLHSLTWIACTMISGCGLPPSLCRDGHCTAGEFTKNGWRPFIFFTFFTFFLSKPFLALHKSNPEMALLSRYCHSKEHQILCRYGVKVQWVRHALKKDMGNQKSTLKNSLFC